MDKSKVFISHISEEARIAKLISERVSADFLGMIDIFVSSDHVSISVGSKWLDEVDAALKDAQIELVICSSHSVTRPWINFEAGAGWVKGIPIVPICHTGMRPVDLPIPLNMLQGIEASDPGGWQRVYTLLASKLGSTVPRADFSDLLADIETFEQDYGLLREVSAAIRTLTKLLPKVQQIFTLGPANNRAHGDINEIVMDKMRPHLDLLQSKGMIEYATGENKLSLGKGGGSVIELGIEVKPAYNTIVDRLDL